MLPQINPMATDLPKFARLLDGSLATESMGDITKIPEFFTKRLAIVVDFFKTNDEDLKEYSTKDMNVYFKELANNRYVLHKAINRVDYAVIKRRKVPVTTGLNVDILELTNILTESNAIITTNLDKVLKDTIVLIAKLTSDKDYRLSSRPIATNQQYVKDTAKLEANIAKIIDPQNISDLRTIRELMPSLPYLTKAIDNGLEYSGKSSLDIYSSISKSVNTITNYSEALYDALKEDKVHIKKGRVIEISEYLQASANFVTQAVNTLYLSNQSVIIMNNLVKTVVAS